MFLSLSPSVAPCLAACGHALAYFMTIEIHMRRNRLFAV
jgi:hypothetical protein